MIGKHAKVLGAFMQAFGSTFRVGRQLQAAVKAQSSTQAPGASRLWARNARLILEDGIAILMEDLQAQLRMRDPSQPLVPEQAEGYRFLIQRGRMAMDGPSISALMDRYAFPSGAPAPLTDIHIKLPDGKIRMSATFRPARFVTVNLGLELTVAATADGLIAMTPVSIRAQGLPVDRLMGVLGLELGRFVPAGGKLRVEHGVILANPVGMLPAPEATGTLVGVDVVGEHLVMSYDDGQPAVDPPLAEPAADSYIAMLGHDLLVGKITMKDVCLQMVPLDAEAHWIEFALPRYRSQLAAGESSLRFGDELLYRIPAVDDLP